MEGLALLVVLYRRLVQPVRRHPAPDARRRRGYRFRHADPSRELRYREEALAAVDTAKERMRGGSSEVVLFIRFVHGRKC